MRSSLVVVLAGLLGSSIAGAQTPCSPERLRQAAKAVASVRHLLHEQAVTENDPAISGQVAAQLGQLKDALAQSAQAAFACASPSATSEQLEGTLAGALHANLSSPADVVVETRGKKELGAFGSDLAVQVFPLSGSPKYYEVDFRYGIQCGDDNLLFIFAADPASDGPDSAHWKQILRWDAPSYTTAADAFGDFVLLTPLSGFPGQRNWRFAVAHGHPGCGAANGSSRFDLDVLEPNLGPGSGSNPGPNPTSSPGQSADLTHPQVVWHLDHSYARNQVPRLSTTEDTLTFELSPPETKAQTPAVSAHTDVYRYRIRHDNRVEPLTASEVPPPAPSAASRRSRP